MTLGQADIKALGKWQTVSNSFTCFQQLLRSEKIFQFKMAVWKNYPQGLLLYVALTSALIMFGLTGQAEAAGGSCWAAPIAFGPKCTSNSGLIGSPGHQVTYSVSPSNNASPLICCEGIGYDSNQKEIWRSIGCGYSKFRGTLPWGNVASNPAIRCKGNPFGSFVNWSH